MKEKRNTQEMTFYGGTEFNRINGNEFFIISNKDLKAAVGSKEQKLNYGLNVAPSCPNQHQQLADESSSLFVFTEGEYVLDFLSTKEVYFKIEEPAVFSVSIPDDAVVFTEGMKFDNSEYFPPKYFADKIIINYQLVDNDFLHFFKTQGWIYDYYKKQEEVICRFLVRNNFIETLRFLKSGVAKDLKNRPIVYAWNVSTSQEAARTGNIQLLEEMCKINKDDIFDKKTRCPIDSYALVAFDLFINATSTTDKSNDKREKVKSLIYQQFHQRNSKILVYS